MALIDKGISSMLLPFTAPFAGVNQPLEGCLGLQGVSHPSATYIALLTKLAHGSMFGTASTIRQSGSWNMRAHVFHLACLAPSSP